MAGQIIRKRPVGRTRNPRLPGRPLTQGRIRSRRADRRPHPFSIVGIILGEPFEQPPTEEGAIDRRLRQPAQVGTARPDRPFPRPDAVGEGPGPRGQRLLQVGRQPAPAGGHRRGPDHRLGASPPQGGQGTAPEPETKDRHESPHDRKPAEATGRRPPRPPGVVAGRGPACHWAGRGESGRPTGCRRDLPAGEEGDAIPLYRAELRERPARNRPHPLGAATGHANGHPRAPQRGCLTRGRPRPLIPQGGGANPPSRGPQAGGPTA